MKRSILLLLSHSCNLNCKYCYETHKDKRKMSLSKAISVLEKEFSDTPENIEIINLLGGEPLMNYEIIPGICEWVWSKNPNMQIFIRTNGTLLNNERKDWFARHANNLGLGLSIDGLPSTTFFNRGAKDLDLDYFMTYWPEVPLKMTIFPATIKELADSIIYLHQKGFSITGGLAQGVQWDDASTRELDHQLSIITDYYISHPELTPISPLLSLDFDHYGDEYTIQRPCWERNPVHTYDCDNERLPCHFFSSIVQGNYRESILKDVRNITHQIDDDDCKSCEIRWMCSNCMGMNYQHTKDFKTNVNKKFLCNCRKICAKWSAKIVLGRAIDHPIVESTDQKEIISNALKAYNRYF